MKKSLLPVLESIYKTFNKKKFLSPDPLQFLDPYVDKRDIEIAGFIAASFALGNVRGIIGIVGKILSIMKKPCAFLTKNSEEEIKEKVFGLKYRFYKSCDIANFLIIIKQCISKFGSLEKCFVGGYREKDITVLPALINFHRKLTPSGRCIILPDPKKGSACKRFNLFLRWMIRNDCIDPGIWRSIPASKLIIPLDTHMLKISNMLDFTSSDSANMKNALRITAAFRDINPLDPVKYDFSLTRAGIHPDLSYEDIHKKFVE